MSSRIMLFGATVQNMRVIISPRPAHLKFQKEIFTFYFYYINWQLGQAHYKGCISACKFLYAYVCVYKCSFYHDIFQAILHILAHIVSIFMLFGPFISLFYTHDNQPFCHLSSPQLSLLPRSIGSWLWCLFFFFSCLPQRIIPAVISSEANDFIRSEYSEPAFSWNGFSGLNPSHASVSCACGNATS